MLHQVGDALPHAMSGTELSRVRTELRLLPPEAYQQKSDRPIYRELVKALGIGRGSDRRRPRQNLAEAARDDYVLPRFQHPDTHHDLIGIFGNASARLRGTGGWI